MYLKSVLVLCFKSKETGDCSISTHNVQTYHPDFSFVIFRFFLLYPLIRIFLFLPFLFVKFGLQWEGEENRKNGGKE